MSENNFEQHSDDDGYDKFEDIEKVKINPQTIFKFSKSQISN